MKFIQSTLGACPRIENLLQKISFGHFFRSFSLNSTTIRLKSTKKLIQKSFLSLRLLFSDRLLVIIAATLFSNTILAGVYKCTDTQGNTAYQSTPCAQHKKAVEIDIKTGGVKDLSLEKKQKELALVLKEQQKAKQQKKSELEAQRRIEAMEQSQINQQLIKNNPIQFSAFAIPPYNTDKLPELVKQYQTRLPEIEKFRRIAAQKALATGECKRVEADELSIKSTSDQLVFSVDCSSGRTFYFNETELIK